MAKWQIDAMLDAGLQYIIDNTTEMYLCTSQPADRAAAIAADVANVTGLNSGDFTAPANGDSSGRKIVVSAQNGLTAIDDGDATHVALCSGSVLLYVTDHTSQAVTTGNTVNIGAWDIELADVTP
jgi:hypothetical protein